MTRAAETTKPRSFQEILLRLSLYWGEQGCAVLQPYDLEVGAGTFHPATTLRALGPRHWAAAYVQPSRRPTDGRYGENPNRLQHYYQYQVLIKPSPPNLQDLYLGSLRAIGIDRSADRVTARVDVPPKAKLAPDAPPNVTANDDPRKPRQGRGVPANGDVRLRVRGVPVLQPDLGLQPPTDWDGRPRKARCTRTTCTRPSCTCWAWITSG